MKSVFNEMERNNTIEGNPEKINQKRESSSLTVEQEVSFRKGIFPSSYDILKGAIDIHIHAGPTIVPRTVDYLECAMMAHYAGMRALVYKPLYFATMGLAYSATKIVGDVQVFGGLVLDHIMGGLSDDAVKRAISAGAKIIWMPLFDAEHTRKLTEAVPHYKERVGSKPPVLVFDGDGNLLPETRKVLKTIADAKSVILATGHLSPEECLVLAKEAKEIGIEHVVATHANATIIGATVDQMYELAEMGVWIELSIANLLAGPEDPTLTWNAIKKVGIERCILSTDMGNLYLPTPVEGLRMFIEQARRGTGLDNVEQMIKENPAKLLGLE